MPRQEIVLQAFVGSPADVSEERELLEGIVSELNKSWSKSLGFRLELIRWETDIHPCFSLNPQDVINEQTSARYDIFIGIFWGRIGTSTNRAVSGTIEEFQKAYSQFQDDRNSIDILLYFKDAPLSPSKINPKQLDELLKFKNSLGELGGLYWEFKDSSDFEATLRSHLSAIAQKWAKKEFNNYVGRLSVDPQQTNDVEDDEDDYGLIDCLDSFNEQNEKMCLSLKYITDATFDIEKSIKIQTDAINSIGKIIDKAQLSGAKKIIKALSKDLDKYGSTIDVELPNLSKSRKGALDSLSKALLLYRDFDSDEKDISSLEQSIKFMREAALGSRISLIKFKEKILALPRIMSQFNKAKKHVIKSLDNMCDELNASVQVSQNIIDSIVEIKS